MEVVVGWLLFAGLVAYWAGTRGRSGLGWFVLACLLSPLVAALILAILPKSGAASLPRDETGAAITPDTHVRCPDCRELVRRDARKCRHCNTALVPQ